MTVYCRRSEVFTGIIWLRVRLAWGLRVTRMAEVQSGSGFQPIEVVVGMGGVAGLNTLHRKSKIFKPSSLLGNITESQYSTPHQLLAQFSIKPIY